MWEETTNQKEIILIEKLKVSLSTSFLHRVIIMPLENCIRN